MLVSKVHLEGFNDEDVISRQDHEEETEKLELEIQQCKEMIKTQQQLLQVNGGYLFKTVLPWEGPECSWIFLGFYLFRKICSIWHLPDLN